MLLQAILDIHRLTDVHDGPGAVPQEVDAREAWKELGLRERLPEKG